MKITLDTKFNIGDVVYALEHYYNFYAIPTPYIISDIIVNVSNKDVRTMYCVEQGGFTDHFPEDWLFTSHEECQKWCKEHNQRRKI